MRFGEARKFTLNAEDEQGRGAAHVKGNVTDQTIIEEALRRIEAGRDLSRAEADAAMEELLAGRMAHEEIVRLLRALRAKGETVEELVGFAMAMRRHVEPIRLTGTRLSDGFVAEFPLVDTCGTGGDCSGTFNVSTAAAFRGGRGRRARGQTRQSFAQLALGLGRRVGSDAREHQCDARTGCGGP